MRLHGDANARGVRVDSDVSRTQLHFRATPRTLHLRRDVIGACVDRELRDINERVSRANAE